MCRFSSAVLHAHKAVVVVPDGAAVAAAARAAVACGRVSVSARPYRPTGGVRCGGDGDSHPEAFIVYPGIPGTLHTT